jgi:hypothetical protein
MPFPPPPVETASAINIDAPARIPAASKIERIMNS